MQRVTITCTQSFQDDEVIGTGTFQSSDIGMECWRNAIMSAATASGFSPRTVKNFVLEWAEELERFDV